MSLLDRLGLRGRALLAKIYLLLLFLLVLRLTWRPYRPFDDFWAHAAVGRWIWEHGQAPLHTLFLWSARQPWVAHSWLSELLFYGMLTVGGESPEFYLLHAFACLLGFLSVFLLWCLWRRRSSSLSGPAVLFLLALTCSHDRFYPRAELFSFLFLTILVIFLIRWSDALPGDGAPSLSRGEKLQFMGIVLLFALWANLHGGVALGLLFLGTASVCELLQDRFRKRSWWLALLGLLGAAAVCATPYGIHYWQVFRPIGGRMFAYITEWRPVWQEPLLPWYVLLLGALMSGLALLASVLNPQRRWMHIAWMFVATGSWLAARRNIWPMFLVSLAVLAANARVLETERLQAAFRRCFGGAEGGAASAGLANLRALAVLGVFLVWAGLMHASRFITPPPARAPAGIVHFLQEKQLSGRVFNDYPYSGYLEWRFGEQLPLYIDLLNAYPEELHVEYANVLLNNGDARDFLYRRSVGYVLIVSPNPEGPWLWPFAAYIENDSRWVRIYAGEDGMIWVRRTPQYEHLWRPILSNSKR